MLDVKRKMNRKRGCFAAASKKERGAIGKGRRCWSCKMNVMSRHRPPEDVGPML